jgi:hypothetical protein
MRTRARVDDNQSEVVSAFRRCGFTVAHTHTIGKGFPDLVVAKFGKTALIEVKDGRKPPSARKLTKDEAEFHTAWSGDIYIVEDVDDVIGLNEIWIKRIEKGEERLP